MFLNEYLEHRKKNSNKRFTESVFLYSLHTVQTMSFRLYYSNWTHSEEGIYTELFIIWRFGSYRTVNT